MACVPRRATGPERESVAWIEPAGTPSRAASASETLPTDPSALWRSRLGKTATGTPVVGEHVIVAQAADRWLVLLDRETGDRLWRRRLTGPGAGSALLNGDRIYAASTGLNGSVYSIALRDGGQHWRREVGPIAGSVALAGGTVLAATERGTLVGIGVDRGDIRWERRLGAQLRTGPTLLDDVALVATDDSLFLVTVSDGSIRTAAASPGAVLAAPATTENLVVVGSPDGLVVGLDGHTLAERWRVATDGPVYAGVAIARDTVFAVTGSGTLYRIALARPQAYDSLVLDLPVIGPPVPVRGGVLIGTAGGELVFVGSDTAPGQPVLRVDGPLTYAVLVRDQTIYVADGRGGIEAWR